MQLAVAQREHGPDGPVEAGAEGVDVTTLGRVGDVVEGEHAALVIEEHAHSRHAMRFRGGVARYEDEVLAALVDGREPARSGRNTLFFV